jgi:hypothetical protein
MAEVQPRRNKTTPPTVRPAASLAVLLLSPLHTLVAAAGRRSSPSNSTWGLLGARRNNQTTGRVLQAVLRSRYVACSKSIDRLFWWRGCTDGFVELLSSHARLVDSVLLVRQPDGVFPASRTPHPTSTTQQSNVRTGAASRSALKVRRSLESIKVP